jgi:hypothetical protein
MTTKPRPQFAKPGENKDRFSTAASFAKSTEEINSSATIVDESRESWECPTELRKDMKRYLVDSKLFKNKKEFLTQCLIDGLAKYKD